MTKSYRWLADRLNAWGDRQAEAVLKEMEESSALYADKTLRKMRRCICLAVYILCIDVFVFALHWPGFEAFIAALALVAAVLSVAAGAYSDTTTGGRG